MHQLPDWVSGLLSCPSPVHLLTFITQIWSGKSLVQSYLMAPTVFQINHNSLGKQTGKVFAAPPAPSLTFQPGFPPSPILFTHSPPCALTSHPPVPGRHQTSSSDLATNRPFLPMGRFSFCSPSALPALLRLSSSFRSRLPEDFPDPSESGKSLCLLTPQNIISFLFTSFT